MFILKKRSNIWYQLKGWRQYFYLFISAKYLKIKTILMAAEFKDMCNLDVFKKDSKK